MTLEEAGEIDVVRDDPLLWFQGFGRYRHEQTRLPTRGRANVLQRRMFSYYKKCQDENRPCRMVACKYRRAGSSTGGAAQTHMQVLNHRTRFGVIGMDYRSASNMLEMVRFFGEHDDFPGWSFRWSNNVKSMETAIAKPETAEHATVPWEEWFDGQKPESIPMSDRADRIIATKIRYKHDSEIELYTAKNSKSARSAGLQGYHATEVAHWPMGGVHDAAETLKAMRQTLPKAGFHFALEESTANGVQGAFYETCKSARWPDEPWTKQFKQAWPLEEQRFERDLQFVFIFAAWFEDDRYKSKPLSPEDETFLRENLDEDERALIARYGQDGPKGQRLGAEVNATVWEQLAWRRGIIANVCTKMGVEEFKQEYPSDPREAFRSSGSPALDPDGVLALEAMCRGVEPEWGTLTVQERTGSISFDRCNMEQATVAMWERPFEGGHYLLPVDCMSGAEQVTGTGIKDRHAPLMLRKAYQDDKKAFHRTRLVARIKHPCQWDEKVLLRQVHLLARYYGARDDVGATIVPEVEGGCGTALAMDLIELGANVYQREEFDSVTQKTTKKLGWMTTKSTRPIAIGELQHYVREQMVEVHCPHVVAELMSLVVNKDGKAEASSGAHDDNAMAMAIGLACIDHAAEITKPRAVRRVPADEHLWKTVGR